MPFHLPLIRSCVLAMLAIASLSLPKAKAQVKIDRVPLPFDLTGAPVPTPPKPAAEGAAAAATPPPAATTSSTLITGPVSHVYVYVEPYQIRVEALFDMHAVFKWLVPDEKELPETLSPERQAQVVVDAEKLAADWCSLTTNEGRQPYIAPAAFFVKGKPGATLPM